MPTADLILVSSDVISLPTNNSVTIQVKNQSASVTALNIKATLPTSWTDVSQSLTNCTSVAPGQVCTIMITAGDAIHALVNLPINGTNTNVVLNQIEIIQATTLSASISSLAVSVNNTGVNAALTGTPRQIIITNTGTVNALSVTYSLSNALPSGTTISPASCGVIAPSANCTLTITPGDAPSSTPGDVSPSPVALLISGSNTNSLTPEVQIVTYGSVFQSGYIFSVDDTTPDTGSIGGKILGLTNESNAIAWGGYGTNIGASTYDTNISGANDGAANTSAIVEALGAGSYAAITCFNSSVGGFTDWYLPSICEMAPHTSICYAGSTNILQQLFEASPTIGNIPDRGSYWTSTQTNGSPSIAAFHHYFASGGNSANYGEEKRTALAVRCVRKIS